MTEKYDDEYDEYVKLFEESNRWYALDKLEKWNKWDKFLEAVPIKRCHHFGEVNIFNLIPITCKDVKTEELVKLIKEKDIKAWLILDIGCLLNLDIEKLDKTNIKYYFTPIDDFDVPSFETMNKMIEFISDNIKFGNVMISCIGGHGRTGIVLSVWAGLNEIEKPIEYVRKTYCEEAVETLSQEMFVNIYLRYLKSL